MERFCDILKNLRNAKCLTQEELAKKLSISRSAIGMYESGSRVPDVESLEKFADFFNVDINFLIGRTNKTTYIPESWDGSNAVKIPILGTVVAGMPISAYQDILGYEEITPEMAQTGEFYALKVKGNSMEPRICEGDIVIVKVQPDVECGDIAVVIVNGDEATVKKISKSEEGITLIANNTAVYTPRFYTNKQIAELPVIISGKVVELRAQF